MKIAIHLKSKFTIIISALIFLTLIVSIFAGIILFRPKKAETETKGNYTYNSINLLDNSMDQLTIGDNENELAHKLEKKGSITSDKVSYSIGLIESEKSAIFFNAINDTVNFTMDISSYTPKKESNPVVLELEELHTSNYDEFGYTVSVNDKPVYFRTYGQLMTGTVSYYINISRSDLTDLKNVKITITNKSSSKFGITKAVLYSDLYGMAETQNFDIKKMGINNFVGSNKLNTLGSEMEQYKGEYKTFQIGIGTDYSFIQTNTTNMKAKIDTLINFGKTFKMPIHIMPARWWGTTTSTVDGNGGYFSDLKHNQVVYNPVTKSYEPTIPNQWSNTQWPSMNSKEVKEAGVSKIKDLATYFSRRLALNEAKAPGQLPPFYFMMEWGAGYWGTDFNKGGDYADIVIKAAADDGVTLDPTDGLSSQEKHWMINNVAEYMNEEAVAYNESLYSNSVGVNKGTISYPAYQITNNVYSHALQGTIYPSYDKKIALWPSGVSNFSWPSSEMYNFEDNRFYDYSMSLGKIACVNLEMTMLTKIFFQDYIRKSYANGMEFVTMFNANKKEEGMYIRQLDPLPETEYEDTPAYDKLILDVDALRDNQEINKNGVPNTVKVSNLHTGASGWLELINADSPGEIVFKATNDTGFNTGYHLQLEAFYQKEGKVTVYAGTSLSNMEKLPDFVMGQSVDWFNKATLYTQDLSKFKDSKEIYVKVVITADLIEDTFIRALRITVPWQQKTGQLNNQKVTYLQKRIQSLNTQYREVCARMLKQYLKKIGTENEKYKKAQSLIGNAQFFDAYNFLCMAISEALPATYSVTGHGKLGDYPVEAALSSDSNYAVVRILKASSSVYEFSFISDKIQDIKLTISGLEKNKKYSLVYTGSNLVEVKEDDNGNLLTKETLVCTVKISPDTDKIITGQVEGVVKTSSDSGLMLEVQDREIGKYSSGLSLSYSSDCTFSRSLEGSSEVAKTKPKVNDYAVITLDSTGIITSVAAKYGTITGVVKKYYQPEVKGENATNGVVELTNGMKFEIKYSLDMTNFNLATISGKAKDMTYAALKAAVKPCSIVTIDYIPITYNNTLRPMISISEDKISLLSEDFEGDFESRIWSKKNIAVQPLDKQNSYKVIQPSVTNADPGELVYKFEMTRPISTANINFMGRAIMNAKCYVKIYTSLDGKNWTQLYQMLYTDADSLNPKLLRNVDISNAVENARTFYVKFEIASTTETWGSINDISINAVTK